MNEEKLYDEISRAITFKGEDEEGNPVVNTELLYKATDSAISYIVRFCIQYILEKHPYKDQSATIKRHVMENKRSEREIERLKNVTV